MTGQHRYDLPSLSPLVPRRERTPGHSDAPCAPELGKDAFHRVPFIPGGVRDAVERVLTIPEARFRESALGLRAVGLAYVDPFTRRRVEICAPLEGFVREYGFDLPRL